MDREEHEGKENDKQAGDGHQEGSDGVEDGDGTIVIPTDGNTPIFAALKVFILDVVFKFIKTRIILQTCRYITSVKVAGVGGNRKLSNLPVVVGFILNVLLE